jgi:hypothetical protein
LRGCLDKFRCLLAPSTGAAARRGHGDNNDNNTRGGCGLATTPEAQRRDKLQIPSTKPACRQAGFKQGPNLPAGRRVSRSKFQTHMRPLNGLRIADCDRRAPRRGGLRIWDLGSVFCLPPSAFRLPPSAFRLPPSAFRLPPSAFRLLPSAFRLPPSPSRPHPAARKPRGHPRPPGRALSRPEN